MSVATADAADQFRRAIEMLALDTNSEFGLADSLIVAGKPDEAKSHFAASAELNPDPTTADTVTRPRGHGDPAIMPPAS